MMIIVNTDASVVFGQAGNSAWASFVAYTDDGRLLHQHVERVMADDPVHAELHGLRLALEFLGGRRAVIRTDCQAVLRYARRKRCKNLAHREVLAHIRALMGYRQKVRWIPRGKNREADRLCRKARKAAKGQAA
jgi:ribonuclease HI